MNYFTVDAGSGGLVLGNETANVLDIVAGVLNGQILGFTNDSVTPSGLMQGLRFRLGGAGVHPFVIAGSGDWIVNNHLRSADGSGSMLIQKEGPGTMTWTGTNIGPRAVNWFGNLASPIIINGGTMILKTSDLVDTSAGGPSIVHNGTLLKYDVQPMPGYVTGPATISGNISGSGPIQINAGMLTLSGANTVSGSITLSGGTLVAGSTEAVGLSGPLGHGGTISFSGGTLQFSTNNAFDYSPRFSTAAGQQYTIDTAGQDVTFATGLNSSGGALSKLGAGTLTLIGGSSYSGPTTVNAGKLIFQGAKTGSGDITVADGGTLGIYDAGTPATPATLILGTGSGAILEFGNVNSTTTAPLAPAALSSAGTLTIKINSGTFAIGQSYPLLSWTSGSVPAVSPGSLNGALGYLTTNGNTILLNISLPTLTWSGAADGTWNTAAPNNWLLAGNSITYSNPAPVLFDDTAAGTTTVIVSAQVQPTSLTVSNSTKDYSITSSGGNNIGGSTGLTKNGSGTLTLSGGANTYTGVTTISGGVMAVGALANGGSPSDIGQAGSDATNLVLNGGTLRYTGFPTSIDRLFTLGPGGGAIAAENVGILTLNNSGSVVVIGSGPRVLTLTGENQADNVFAASVSDSPFGGATSLTKSGNGSWILTGSNTYSGTTTIAAGVLVVGGEAGSLGSGNVIDNTALVFYRGGTLTFSSTISGPGDVIVDSGTVIFAGGNTYAGFTEIYGGTLIINSNNVASSTTVIGGTLGGIGTLAGPVTVNAGTTLAPGASAGSIGTLTLNGGLSIGGNLAIEVNKSLSQSNDLVTVIGVLSNTGTGTLTVANLGPALIVGDKFKLFSKPLQNGAAMTVNGAGVTWINNLAVDGSISVGSPVPTGILGFTNLGNAIQLFWAGNYKLQAQTNSLLVGLSTNWSDYPGGSNSPVTVPIVLTNEAVFFRLAPIGNGFIYDQQSTPNDSGPDLGTGIQDNQPIGQSFVPTFSSVGFIRLFLSDIDSGNGVGATVYVNLWSNAIGTGTLLGSTKTVYLPRGFNTWTNFFFLPAVNVTPGTTYYLQPVTEAGGDTVNVGLTAGTAYTNGTAILFGVPFSTYDLWFREGIVAP